MAVWARPARQPLASFSSFSFWLAPQEEPEAYSLTERQRCCRVTPRSIQFWFGPGPPRHHLHSSSHCAPPPRSSAGSHPCWDSPTPATAQHCPLQRRRRSSTRASSPSSFESWPASSASSASSPRCSALALSSNSCSAVPHRHLRADHNQRILLRAIGNLRSPSRFQIRTNSLLDPGSPLSFLDCSLKLLLPSME